MTTDEKTVMDAGKAPRGLTIKLTGEAIAGWRH